MLIIDPSVQRNCKHDAICLNKSKTSNDANVMKQNQRYLYNLSTAATPVKHMLNPVVMYGFILKPCFILGSYVWFHQETNKHIKPLQGPIQSDRMPSGCGGGMARWPLTTS